MKKYEIIIKYIERLVKSNELSQGDKLPPIRTMSIKFNCNKSTVIRAYKELETNHKIYSIPKSGYYLVEKNNLETEEYNCINFSEVMPDPKLLPYREFNHCVNRAIELYKSNLFTYINTQGLDSLRNVLVSHFSNQQIFTTEDRIFITSGSQQALSILVKMPFPNEKNNILVEQPTYKLMNGLAKINGHRLIGINRNYNGIDFDELETLFSKGDIKFFYSIPRYHNPLGTSYSEKEKIKIVQLAEKYNVYIIEDDYLGDIQINKKELPLFYYDLSNKVIYLKSFSKAFMPGIRIGAVILHDELRKEFLKHKRYSDLNTSVLAQGALEIFINSGMYSNHIKKARLEYKKKMDCVRQCFKELNTYGIDYLIPETGFFVWINLPKKVNINVLIEKLLKRKIYILHPKEFYIENNLYQNSLSICISKLEKEKIRVGIRMILEEITKLI